MTMGFCQTHRRLLDGLSLLAALAMDDGILRQLMLAFQPASGTNHTIIRHLHLRRHVALALECISLADFQCLDGAAHFENIVGTDYQHGWFFQGRFTRHTGVMNNRGVLLNEAILADDDRAGFGDNIDARMDDGARGDGDVTGENTLLTVAYNRLWHYFQTANRATPISINKK